MSTSSLSPEVLVPRLGEYLVEKGLILPADLQRALKQQSIMRDKGEDRLIGQVLVDLEIITASIRDTAITELVLQLRSALQEANQHLIEANQQLEQRVRERTAELQNAMDKLAEVNQLKANMVANISHELRTPLTHLKGYLDILLTGDLGQLTDQQQNALEIMGRSSDRLGRLIEDLILYSLSEREKMQLRLAPFSMEAMCKIAIQKYKPKARERKIKLLLECDPNLPQVNADEDKIAWVVAQFIDNAIKFTQPGGTVTVRVNQDQTLICTAVVDTGIGIPAARTEEIFDLFHQLDGSTTRRAGGTGLGLALAKKIVEAHSSAIQVSSEIGKGSAFSFNLKVYNGRKLENPVSPG